MTGRHTTIPSFYSWFSLATGACVWDCTSGGGSGGWVSECSFPLLSCRLLCSTRLDRDLLLARIIDVHIRPSDAYFVHSLFMYRTTRQLPTTINKTRSHEMSLVEKTSIGANSFLFFFFWLLCVCGAPSVTWEKEKEKPPTPIDCTNATVYTSYWSLKRENIYSRVEEQEKSDRRKRGE